MSEHKSHILVVDDDDRLRDLLKRFLSREGHDVTVAKDAASARRFLQTMSFDLLVFDVMMPGEDGFSLLKGIRQTVDTPVIFLTARGLPSERIGGLKLGADDYLPKPFEPEELSLRIGAILKRAAPERPPEEIRLSGMIFHVGKNELRKDGRLVRLTESEAQLLAILAGRAGAPLRGRNSPPSPPQASSALSTSRSRACAARLNVTRASLCICKQCAASATG